MTLTPAPHSRLAEFSDLVHLIYAAGANPALWREAVAELGRSLKGTRALLFTPLATPQAGGFIFPWQMDDAYIALWATKYIAHDVWTQAAQRQGRVLTGNVMTDEELLPTAELHASVYYREFLSAHDVEHVCAGVIFEGEPGLPTTIATIYRSKSAAPFQPEDKQWLALLIPHFSRALGLMHRLNLARHQEQSLRAALNRLSVGVLLLDTQFRVTFINTAGQRAMERQDGLAMDSAQRLRATASGERHGQGITQWLTQLAGTAHTDRSGFNDTHRVRRTGNAATYMLQCCPLEPTDPLTLHEGARHIVFVTDPDQIRLPSPTQLQQQLGLTPAESRIALALAQGMTYRDAATQGQVTEETLRTHAKNIYTKTGVNQKAELTRLVVSLGSVGV